MGGNAEAPNNTQEQPKRNGVVMNLRHYHEYRELTLEEMMDFVDDKAPGWICSISWLSRCYVRMDFNSFRVIFTRSSQSFAV